MDGIYAILCLGLLSAISISIIIFRVDPLLSFASGIGVWVASLLGVSEGVPSPVPPCRKVRIQKETYKTTRNYRQETIHESLSQEICKPLREESTQNSGRGNSDQICRENPAFRLET